MITLIIAVYKRLDFLELVLLSLKEQKFKDFEVIIAEDAQDSETIDFIQRWKKKSEFKIGHVSQTDDGFRKTTILNKAVKAAAGDKLVFIDGDCILHTGFLEAYEKRITEGFFYFGRRCGLSADFTAGLMQTKNLKNITLFNLIKSGCQYVENAVYLPFQFLPDKPYRQIWGCNWGVLKAHILTVNGFDQDYNEACAGEDLDIDWRLKISGLRIKSVKHQAIAYHMHHIANYDPEVQFRMEALMADKIQTGDYICLNGMDKIS